MITNVWFDWKRYIVNCREEQLIDKIKQIVEKWWIILGWSVCPELQAMMYHEYECDIWVEIRENIMELQLEEIIWKMTNKPTETTVT